MGIRVGIVGTGNCAKSLIEGIAFYSCLGAPEAGLMRPLVGPYRVTDIEFVCAFDIDDRKVGRPLRDALTAEPNRTEPLCAIPDIPVIVERGPTVDSVIPPLQDFYVHESNERPVDLVATLKRTRTEVLVNYLPTGSDIAALTYATAALTAQVNFVNCMPSPLAKTSELREKFEAAGLVLMGDDIKSQFGTTILNRIILSLCRLRGIHVLSSEQVNIGGNADHFNLQFRAKEKEEAKQAALRSVIATDDSTPSVAMIYEVANHDHKHARISIKATAFGRAPITVDVSLDCEDSPNSAGVVVDAIRAAKILTGTANARRAVEICAGLMKSPCIQLAEDEASKQFDAVISECLGARFSEYQLQH